MRSVCAFPPCDRPVHSRGLCEPHGEQRDRGQELRPVKIYMKQTDRDDQGRKYCRKGKHWLPVSNFGPYARSSDGLSYRCLQCASDQHRLRRYGLTLERYDEILASQGGGCAICGEQCATGRQLAVDHDHGCCAVPPSDRTCGKCVRGLLCASCNNALGAFRDSPRLLLIAADYLVKHA